MRNRLCSSLVLITFYGFFRAAWITRYNAALQARLAPLQTANNNVQYGLSRSMTPSDAIFGLATLGVLSILIFLWLSYALEQRAQRPWFARG